MELISIGLTFESTPIEMRESLSFDSHSLTLALQQLRDEKSILEVVIVSTCNRTEIFALVDQLHTGRYYIKQFFARFFSQEVDSLRPYFIIHTAEKAVEHLFLLVCGIESQIIGETQILGQVKKAYLVAQQVGTTGMVFNRLFQQAFRFAKHIQTNYALYEKTQSVGHQVSSLIRRQENNSQKTALLIGVGEIGKLMLPYLDSAKLSKVWVMNRTYQKAVNAIAPYDHNFHAVSLQDMMTYLEAADFIITAVDQVQPIITSEMIRETVEKRGAIYDQYYFDLGLPRNIENGPNVDELAVKIYDVDSLTATIEQDNGVLMERIEEVKKNVWDEVSSFYQWLGGLEVTPIIKQIRQHQLAHLTEIQESLAQKLPDLDAASKKVINKHLKSLVNAMIKQPIIATKEAVGKPMAKEKLAFVQSLFGISQEILPGWTDHMNHKHLVKVGSRGSHLALSQTQQVIDQLKQRFPLVQFEIVVIKTQGDRDQKSRIADIGGKGVFMREIEKQLIDGQIDFAVHSYKDVPTELAKGTVVASVPKRNSAFDCLISRNGASLDQLPQGSVIGTGSLRRIIQLKHYRPDLEFREIRGNIDTRLKKIEIEQLDAIVLAKAGLNRAGYTDQDLAYTLEDFDENLIIPSVGQGALALQCRQDDHSIIEMLSLINHDRTEVCVNCERQFLSALGVDCQYPVGAYAQIKRDGQLHIVGMIGSRDYEQLIRHELCVPISESGSVGHQLFEILLEKGADKIVEQY